MMPSFTTRTLTGADLAQFEALETGYCALHPQRTFTPFMLYLSPYFDEGRNVLCAFDAEDKLIAYAPFFPQNELAWVDIVGLPGLEGEVREALFAWLLERAQEGGQGLLNFQYYPDESEAIAFAGAQGAGYTYSIFALQRDLTLPIPAQSPAEGFEVRRWRMDSQAEQEAYLEARNECFPEAPTRLEEWQFFASGPQWQDGIDIAAFAGERLAASVLVFWEPGSAAGSTEFVFTRAEYRGRGLARTLLAEAMRYLKEHGLEKAALEVKAENQSALKVYRELGYQVAAESRVYQVRV